MLTITDLELRRGASALFSHASFIVHPGWKVGVAGANGSGKSSLFAMIQGALQPDSGSCVVPENIALAHVAQETPAVNDSALEYVLDGDPELRKVQAQLGVAQAQNDGIEVARLHDRLQTIGGYSAEARAARLLDGLGFHAEQLAAPVREFSGGWRMRLNLAQALMCRSDMLLLDEPTNHLDLDAVIWLQDWLRAYPGTLLLISHDRDFLDQVTDHILHIDAGTITLYNGNYSSFEERRAQLLATQKAAAEKQQREIEHMERFVARFRAKATKARQAQSRLKALERMERIAPAHVDSPFSFSFAPPAKMPSPLLQLERADIGYGGQPILRGVRLPILPGDRLGLLGANGAGKSTLIKALAGDIKPVAGGLLRPKDLRIGYFAQHQLEQLDPAASPLLHLQRLQADADEQALRDFLGGFGFCGDAALTPVQPMSGGEKARLVLALLVWQRPNLLLLDEPTNHLDLEMRFALNIALQEFTGAVVLVSHDRYLLRTVCERFMLVDHGAVSEFDGALEEYAAYLSARRRELAQEKGSEGDASSLDRRQRRRRDAELRQRQQPLRKRMQELERNIEAVNEQRAEIEIWLAQSEAYEDHNRERLQRNLRQQGELGQQLQELEQAWVEVGEQLEALQRSD